MPLNRKNPDYAPIAALLDEEKRKLLDRVIDSLKKGENFETGMARVTRGVCPHSTYALLRIALWFWNGGDSPGRRLPEFVKAYLTETRLHGEGESAVRHFSDWLATQLNEGCRLDQRIDNGDVACLDGSNRDRLVRAMAVSLGVNIPPLPERCESCGRVHAEADAKSIATGGLWTCTSCGLSTNLWSKLCGHRCERKVSELQADGGEDQEEKPPSTCVPGAHEELHQCSECSCWVCWACHEISVCVLHTPFIREKLLGTVVE